MNAAVLYIVPEKYSSTSIAWCSSLNVKTIVSTSFTVSVSYSESVQCDAISANVSRVFSITVYTRQATVLK